MIKVDAAIKTRRLLAEDTMEIGFDSPNSFYFQAGQYMTVTVHGLERLPLPEQFHDFSIASSPSQTGELAIAFRVSPSHFKQTLLRAPLGTLVNIEGPKGVFTLLENINQPLIFIAGGIGITPFMSMISFVVEKKLAYNITLYYFNRNRESAAYLEKIERYRSVITFVPIFGLVTKERIIFNAESASAFWYIAGPPGMVSMVRNILSEKNIKDQNIKTEEFTGYE